MKIRTFCFGEGLFDLKWGGGEKKGVKWKGEEGDRVGLKTWKRRGRSGRLEKGDRGMTAYWH